MARRINIPPSELEQLWRSTWPVYQIAQRFGCSPTLVRERAKEIGLHNRKHGLHDYRTIHKLMTDAQKADIFALCKMGKTQAEIALMTGRHETTIRRIIGEFKPWLR